MQGRGKQVDWEEERYSTKAQVADCRWIRSHLRLSPHRAVRLQACMFCCRATHSSSQTAGSINAFMWSTAQSRATARCVYGCACVQVCVCACACVRACVKPRLFPPWDLHKHASHLSFEFHIQRFHSFSCQSFSPPIKALHSQSVYRSRVV